MRRLATALLAISLVALPAAAAEPPRIVIDHQVLFPAPDSQPFIENDRTLVPLRAIFEYLGAEVAWEEATRTVTATRGKTAISLTIDSATAFVDGQPVTLDQPAVLRQNRTFVPLRFVSEAFGATVYWFASAAPVDWMSSLPTVAITTYTLPPAGAPLTPTPATGALQRVTAATGQPLAATGEGIGFLNLATGESELYRIPETDPWTVGYGASSDGRFVFARTIDTGYVLDRQSGEVKSWNRLQYDLVLTGEERHLFQAVRPNPAGWVVEIDPSDGRLSGHLAGTERFIVTNLALEPVAQFDLPAGEAPPAGVTEAVWNPTETQLMLSWDEGTYQVNLDSGDVTPLGAAAKFQAFQGGALVIAERKNDQGTLITRYDWQGQGQTSAPIPAETIKYSADGEWVAWQLMRDNFTPAVYFAPIGQITSPYQALGASLCYGSIGTTGGRWLPGALVVNTREGLRTITKAGEVGTLPTPAGWDHVDPIPAPGSEPLYGFMAGTLEGMKVGAVTPEGKVLASASVQSPRRQYDIARFSPIWTTNPAELRFTVRQQQGAGGPCGDYVIPLPMRLYAPGTYDGSTTLQVVAPGDCVAIRENPWFESPMLRCAPDGERLRLGNEVTGSLPSFHYNEDGQWFQLSEGWVRVSSGLLQFAP